MKIFVIDASVVISVLLEENRKIKKFFVDILEEAKLGKSAVFSLTLLPLEVGNALCFKALNSERRVSSLKLFHQLPIRFMTLEPDQVDNVLEQAVGTGTTVYDTAYHYLAKDLGGTFLTCDKEYFQKAKKLGGIELVGK